MPTQQDKERRHRSRFFAGLYVIVLAGLAVELILRPFLPQYATGQSAFSDLIRLILSLIGFGI